MTYFLPQKIRKMVCFLFKFGIYLLVLLLSHSQDYQVENEVFFLAMGKICNARQILLPIDLQQVALGGITIINKFPDINPSY